MQPKNICLVDYTVYESAYTVGRLKKGSLSACVAFSHFFLFALLISTRMFDISFIGLYFLVRKK